MRRGMGFAQTMVVQLVASRFLEAGRQTIDLATGSPVTVRLLPPCTPGDERTWADSCARLLLAWHEDLPPLVDYGFTPDGRFEAYGPVPSSSLSSGALAAVSAFLGGRTAKTSAFGGRVHVGIHLVPPRALRVLCEILEQGRPGQPFSIAYAAEPGAGTSTFVRLAAHFGRSHGYVPLCSGVLERWPDLPAQIAGRSVLLLCDAGESSQRARRWFFRFGMMSTGGHVLVQVVRHATEPSDLMLRFESVEPDDLVERVHVYPAVDSRRVRAAARVSGGLPARFVARLHGGATRWAEASRVAEAHAAYSAETATEDPEPGHPWRDLIADAARLARTGRSAAAERDLRQIAAAAARRHFGLATACAEVELAYVLLGRGKVAKAGELFKSNVQSHAHVDRLAARAGVGLGFVHLLQGELEAAESAFRVCRAAAPREAGIALGWTLLLEGRDRDAERVLASLGESNESRDRARSATLAAAVALSRQDLPAAARAAGQAITAETRDPVNDAVASVVLTAVHGRIGDIDAVERHARRALVSARAARAPLLALAARAEWLEARHACGVTPARSGVERLLRISERVVPLVRARLLTLVARVHPSDARRAEVAARADLLVRAIGAGGTFLAPVDDTDAVRASDAGRLVGIHESSATPLDTLKGVADWLRERLRARAVLVADAHAAPLARSGPSDAIAAAGRVLQTRVAQPPWISADGLEAAVIVRYGNVVRGSIGCRWPVSRVVGPDAVHVMSAAASVAGPAIALMAEQTTPRPVATDGIVGGSVAVARLRAHIARAGAAPFPVLIEGESGAGKELVARAIHKESPRRLRVCIAINCAALSEELFESEVFGHARGAFTGAHAERAGLFEQADGGTLFLDEVSELSPRAQAKLLRVLQEGEVRRLGENHARRVDVRVVAASNRLLDVEASAGRFRRDLLFRLAVIRIAVPPLRERREDIPLLAAHYWEAAAARAGTRAVLTANAVAQLSRHDWPGNVRELQNIIAALTVQLPRGRVEATHVVALLGGEANAMGSANQEPQRLDDARRAFERRFIAAAIARCGGRHGIAARELGISRQGLAKLLKRLEG